MVIKHLVNNAKEAITGGGKIKIITNNYGSRIDLVIADNGKGLPPLMIKKIFIPFYTTKETSSGLGLAIAQKVIQCHNGSIEVDSEQGGRTVFYYLAACR
ncbi:MAG: hypothetical protein GX982_07700 [Tissierellia bacterium]|nr:hypothetical protein [Tissierellia bacterium]